MSSVELSDEVVPEFVADLATTPFELRNGRCGAQITRHRIGRQWCGDESHLIDVGVIGEDVAFDLSEDQLAPRNVVRVERSDGQQEVAQRRWVEHTCVEYDAS